MSKTIDAMTRLMLKALRDKKCDCIDKATQEKIKEALSDKVKHK